jgi:hypothetical protein
MSVILHPAQQRTTMRRHVSIPCQLVSEPGFHLIGDHCVDLSLKGMQVRANRLARMWTPVLISFRIPDSNIYCDAEGIICRVVWGRRDEDEFPSYGVHFTAMSKTTHRILAARLRGMPPPVPARQVRIDYAASVNSIFQAA